LKTEEHHLYSLRFVHLYEKITRFVFNYIILR
jgi:hypothetical protein